MLTNKQIHTLLLENKDMTAFKKFVGFKSYNAMKFRLESEEPKNNLWGKYEEFLLGRNKIITKGTIANHTRGYIAKNLSSADFKKEIEESNRLVESTFGK